MALMVIGARVWILYTILNIYTTVRYARTYSRYIFDMYIDLMRGVRKKSCRVTENEGY